MLYLVFDTETTGLPKGKNPSIYKTELWPHVLQLSYIIWCNDTHKIITIEDDYIKINNDVIIEEGSQAIHHITREKVDKDGISIEDALHKFNNWAGKCDTLIGHNVSFDKRVLIVEGIRNNIRMNVHDTYCTMKNSTELCRIEREFRDGTKYFKYPSLSELHNHLFNKIPKNTHNALIDILICLRCFCKIELNNDISRTDRTIRMMLRETN
jgi:DNA polymerase III subunit epsilon